MDTFMRTTAVQDFAAGNRSRVTGAGVDAFAYERVTAQLRSLHDWQPAFTAAGRRRVEVARAAEEEGRLVTAADTYREAAAWLHCATVLPHPDREGFATAQAESDDAMRRALALAEPGAQRLEGTSFRGWLRRPGRAADRGGVVIVVPGLDSSKEEFHDVADALLRRGCTVVAIDGPGQGVRAATSVITRTYDRVVSEVIDTVGAARVGVVGLSMGGHYASLAASREQRVRATVCVSGFAELEWDALPPFVQDTLAQRCGGEQEAREFADGARVDAGAIAGELLVVDGGLDVVPGVVGAAAIAEAAPRGQQLVVPHGDHLLGNARPDWLAPAVDWLAARVDRTAA